MDRTVTGDEIRTLTVAHFLLNLRTARKTGIAVFERSGIVKKVYLKDGDVLFASSNVDDDRLGECLLRTGKLTQQQYDASVELMRKTGKKQGAILIELGFITPPSMVQGVKDQITHIVQGLFAWRSGTVRFEEGPFSSADIIPLQMSLGNLILSGVRRVEWDLVRASLPPDEAVLRPSSDPAALFQAADLSSNQKAVLSLIDGKRTIREICSRSQAGDFYTRKVIFIFLALRMVEVGEIATDEDREFVREAVHHAVGQDAGPATPAPASPRQQQILTALEKMESQGHHEVLGVGPSANLQEIQTAYLALARLYHPDRCFEPELCALKPSLETLFNRVTEAYNALREKASRSEFAYLMNQGRVKSSRRTVEESRQPDEDTEAMRHFEQGLEAYQLGSYWAALEAFRKASALDQNNAEYVYHQGLSLARMQGKYYDAEEAFKKAIKLSPANGDYYIELGGLYLKRGLKPRALAVYQDGLKQDPSSEKLREAMSAVA